MKASKIARNIEGVIEDGLKDRPLVVKIRKYENGRVVGTESVEVLGLELANFHGEERVVLLADKKAG